MNTDNAKALRVGFRLPSMLRRFYDQLVCSASWKRRSVSNSFLLTDLGGGGFEKLFRKEFFLAWYDFPQAWQ